MERKKIFKWVDIGLICAFYLISSFSFNYNSQKAFALTKQQNVQKVLIQSRKKHKDLYNLVDNEFRDYLGFFKDVSQYIDVIAEAYKTDRDYYNAIVKDIKEISSKYKYIETEFLKEKDNKKTRGISQIIKEIEVSLNNPLLKKELDELAINKKNSEKVNIYKEIATSNILNEKIKLEISSLERMYESKQRKQYKESGMTKQLEDELKIEILALYKIILDLKYLK